MKLKSWLFDKSYTIKVCSFGFESTFCSFPICIRLQRSCNEISYKPLPTLPNMCAPEEKFKMHGKRKGKFSHFLQFQSSFWARRLKKCNQFNASVIIILNSPQYQNKMAKKSNRSVFLKLGEKLYWFKIFYLDFFAKPDQYWLCFWHFKVRILLLFC